jgi:hypothetical protein
MMPVSIISLALSLSVTTQAPAQRSPGGDSTKAELFAVYQRSHAVKLNKDSAGYVAVFSRGFMGKLLKIMQDQKIPTWQEYMSRVSDLEKKSSAGVTLAAQRAVVTGDRATLTVILTKGCGDPGKPADCLATVAFVREGGAWKIAGERQAEVPTAPPPG